MNIKKFLAIFYLFPFLLWSINTTHVKSNDDAKSKCVAKCLEEYKNKIHQITLQSKSFKPKSWIEKNVNHSQIAEIWGKAQFQEYKGDFSVKAHKETLQISPATEGLKGELNQDSEQIKQQLDNCLEKCKPNETK